MIETTVETAIETAIETVIKIAIEPHENNDKPTKIDENRQITMERRWKDDGKKVERR